jgi:nicotinamidase-related amidase
MARATVRDPLADHLITPENSALLEDHRPVDRTTRNAWEDIVFLEAVRVTGRRRLISCALWTEICMAFPALDAVREGYEVYPVVDAIGGTSVEAHRAGLERVAQAGAHPSAGSRSRASFSATGPARRPCRELSRS